MVDELLASWCFVRSFPDSAISVVLRKNTPVLMVPNLFMTAVIVSS